MIRTMIATIALAVVATVSMQAITLEEIVTNNIEARGGLTNLQALKTLQVAGTMQTMGGEMAFTMYFKDNSKMRMNMSVQGQEIVQAFDGIIGWSINPMMGTTDAQKLPKEQATRFANQADLEGEFVNYEDKGLTLEYVGAEDIDGMTAYKVQVTSPDGESHITYVDAITWFVIRTDREQEMMGQQMMMEILWSNFKDVGGVQLPMQMNIVADGNEFMSMTWTTADVNIDIEDSVFAFPGS